MSYTPNNVCIYLYAFAGGLAGLAASGRYLEDSSQNDYVFPAEQADAFAQAIDTAWGAHEFSNADIQQIQACSQGVWQDRSPLISDKGTSVNTQSYAGVASAIVSLVKAGTAQIEAQGVDPDGCGGAGGGFVAGGDLSGSSSVQEVVGILDNPLPPLSPGFLQWNGTNWEFNAGTGSFTAAGDLSGNSVSQEVIGLLSNPLPGLSTGYLNWTGSVWALSPSSGIFTAGGDLSGSASSQEVIGLLTHALPGLTTGFLNWTGSAWALSATSGSFTAGGDLSGTSSSQEVIGILTHAVPALSAGFLQWTGSVFQWGSPSGTFTAGGDLAGTSTVQEVIGLLTHALPGLSTGYLNWTGAAWALSPASGIFTAGGDLSGTATTQEVIGIRNNSVPVLASGFLQWTGSVFQWATPGGGFTAGGDLSGSASTQEVIGILSHALPGLSTGFLNWTGAAWALSAVSGAFTPGSDLLGNSTSTSTNQYVSSISFSSAPGGGTVAVNGTNTVLNWVSNSIILQKGAAPFVQLGATTTDFIRFGATPGSNGFIRATANVSIIGINGSSILGQTGGGETYLESPPGGDLLLNAAGTRTLFFAVGPTTIGQLAIGATDFIAFGTTPGSVGFIRATATDNIIGVNGTAIFGTNGASNTFINTLAAHSLILQVATANVALFAQATSDFVSLGANAATAGFLRFGVAATTAIAIADISIAAGSNYPIISTDAFNGIQFGWSIATTVANGNGGATALLGQPGLGVGNGGAINITPGVAGSTGGGGSGNCNVNLTASPVNGAEPLFQILRSFSPLMVVNGGNAPGAFFTVPLGGIASNNPLLFQTLGTPFNIASGVGGTLTAAQYSNFVVPITVTGSSLSSNTIIVVPNDVGAVWFFAVDQFSIVNGVTLSFEAGTGAHSGFITGPLAGKTLITVCVYASNSTAVA